MIGLIPLRPPKRWELYDWVLVDLGGDGLIEGYVYSVNYGPECRVSVEIVREMQYLRDGPTVTVRPAPPISVRPLQIIGVLAVSIPTPTPDP